jgi:hypothetical protein
MKNLSHPYNRPGLSPLEFIQAVADDPETDIRWRCRAWDYLADLGKYELPDLTDMPNVIMLADTMLAAFARGGTLMAPLGDIVSESDLSGFNGGAFRLGHVGERRDVDGIGLKQPSGLLLGKAGDRRADQGMSPQRAAGGTIVGVFAG